jgi:hypothetical protein
MMMPVYVCFGGTAHDAPRARWLEAEYLFGIDCTPVSLRFFQEFEPYDPWQ